MIAKMCGQLWEECERCGKEPVYLPYLLCEDCWPKNENQKPKEPDHGIVEDYD